MTDRDRLADALALATPEMLREDAEVFASVARWSRHPGEQERCNRLAALALAIAEMQEHGAFVDGGALPWDIALGMHTSTDIVLGAPTLPAALAALLRAK